MNFEYDPRKNLLNKDKHGIDFQEAQILWQDEQLLVLPLRFEDEDRYACIGMIAGKHWTAIVTYRNKDIRIISVRRSRKNEVQLYES